MPDLDGQFLRELAGWDGEGIPVSSLYLDVDGRRYPRKQDYIARAEALCHGLREQAASLERPARRSVEQDIDRALASAGELDRGRTRGLAIFSASAAGLWRRLTLPRPVRDRALVADRPYLLPLEALVETYESFCTALVDRERARIFTVQMGQIRDRSDILDDVPRQHEQGGWSQARYQRHIDEHAGRHYKHVAEVLLAFYTRGRFDHLILAGPEESVSEFERGLHDYVKRRIVARVALPLTASPADVLERSLAVEETLEESRERQVLERIRAESAARRHAVTGLPAVLEALNEARVDTLVVPFGLSIEGAECSQCHRLFVAGRVCRSCGGALQDVADVVESAVETAIRQSARINTLTYVGDDQGQEVGALLRY